LRAEAVLAHGMRYYAQRKSLVSIYIIARL
jgi:hypothetical protein